MPSCSEAGRTEQGPVVESSEMSLTQPLGRVIRPDFAFLAAVERASGEAVRSCYRCLKCSAGCPLASEMDYPPDRVVRMVQLGLRDQVLQSRAIWLCSSCLACSDRCPNGIDVARVMDTLKQMALAERRHPGEPRMANLHRSFLEVVRRYGRMHEATLILLLKLRTRDWLGDLGSGIGLFLRGKIPPLPRRVSQGAEIAGLFEAAGRRGSAPADGGKAG